MISNGLFDALVHPVAPYYLIRN